MPGRDSDVDGLIFDIDRTLWDASPASAKGWNLGLAKLGIRQASSPEQIKSVAGHPFEECVDIILPGLQTKTPELFDTLNKCESEVVQAEGGEFFNGVLDGIRQLAGEYKIFMVSNCQQWYLKLFLDFSKLRPWLAGFDCYGLSGLSKNEMLLRLKSRHHLHHPVYIGDTAGDETAAKLADVAFIYVSWGFGKPEGKPITVNSFHELLDYLGSGNLDQ